MMSTAIQPGAAGSGPLSNSLQDSKIMNSVQLSEYFQRIGYKGSRELTFETLQAVQAAQAYYIPFETFDISMGRPIVLTFDHLFEKLVKQKRGGYCYEVNALLHFALQSLGFTISLCLARLMGADGNILPASVHMVVIVELEERWLVDVGWGRGFVHPFSLATSAEQHEHRIEPDGDGYNFFSKEKKLHRFNLDKHPLDFFEARNLYHQTSPNSLFAKELACSLPTPQGFEMIRGSVYTKKIDQEKTERKIETDDDYRLLLRNSFGLQLNVKRPVWIEHDGHLLHGPRNRGDWDVYHRIRFEQIHQRYCRELVYDPNDPEEKGLDNFPLVFRKDDSDQVIGTIRIDLLPKNEASFRWIAIDPGFVRQGFGKKMLQLAERFIQERGRKLIRIPATAQSMPFAHHMGYTQEPWDLMPQEECMIAVCKRL